MSQTDPAITTVLAIDYGARRTGLAVGQTLTRQPQALKTLRHPWHRPDWREISKVFAAWQPSLAVVGCPEASGPCAEPAPPIARRIKRFAEELRQREHIRVELVDERYSSALANAELVERRRSGQLRRRIRKEDIDAMAACVILDSWFAQAPRALPSGPAASEANGG